MIYNLNNAQHYQWGGGRCDGWRLVDEENLSLIQERVPPGGSETRHVHARATEIFYILGGEGTLEINGMEHTMRVGDSLMVLPGTPHTFLNRSSSDVTFLVFSTPTTRGDRIEVPNNL